MSISDYYENKILDHMLRAQAFTPPATVYVSLHTADPGETGASEVTGGSYAREAVTFAAASGGTVASSADLTFASMPAATITHTALWDASSAGNCLWTGALSASKTLQAGDTFQILSGNLTVSVD